MNQSDEGSVFDLVGVEPTCLTTKRIRPKHVYYMVNPVIWEAKDLWPGRDDTDGVQVLVCDVLRGEDDKYQCRTSQLVNVNLITGTYETLNSIYQLKV